MTVSVNDKGRVVVQGSDGEIVGNLEPTEAVKLGLDLVDAGEKAAKEAGMTAED